jgi:hypothetical protein
MFGFPSFGELVVAPSLEEVTKDPERPGMAYDENAPLWSIAKEHPQE